MTILRHLADNLQMVRHDGINAIKYVTVDGDLDAPGTWKLQAYVEMPAWKGGGEVAFWLLADRSDRNKHD